MSTSALHDDDVPSAFQIFRSSGVSLLFAAESDAYILHDIPKLVHSILHTVSGYRCKDFVVVVGTETLKSISSLGTQCLY